MPIPLLPVVLALLIAAVAPGQDRVSVSVDQLYARASQTRAVTFNEDVAVTVALGEGIRLDCTDPESGIASVVVCFEPDGQVWITARDSDGYAVERSSSSHDKVDAFLYQIGRTPVLAAAQWSRAEDRFEVTVGLSSDRNFNQGRLAWAKARDKSGGKTAWLLRNRAPFPVAELDENERIAGFVRLWSEVKYNFAFFDQVPDLDWDAVFVETLPKIRAARTGPEYYRVLERCLAKLKDGHTDIWGPGIGVVGDARLPVRLAFDTERRLRIDAVVSLDAVRNDDARREIEAAKLRRGEQITHWDGRPIDALLDDEIRPRICASTPQSSDLEAARRLEAGAHGSRVALRVVAADGTSREVALGRARYGIPSRGARRFEVRDLDDGVVYVSLPSFGNKSIVQQFERELPRVRAAKALIFDVRGNGGGNSGYGWSIVSHVIAEPIAKTVWKTRQYRPAFRAWGRPEIWHHGEKKSIPAKRDAFAGPIAVLVDAATFSAAEDFVVVLHAAKRATVVGRPTGGSTGQPLRIELPGGGGARVCTKRDTYPDGTDFVGVGIIPDVVVDPFLAPQGEDPELDRAVEIVRAAAGK